MARHRTPTNLLALRGSFKHDPQRREERLNEPTPTGALGHAPGYFTEELDAIWTELAAIIPPGVLANADRWIVEIACQLMLKFRKLGLIPGCGLTGSELNQLVACLGRMGMTPSDRSRVGVETAKEQKANHLDELAELAADSRAATLRYRTQ